MRYFLSKNNTYYHCIGKDWILGGCLPRKYLLRVWFWLIEWDNDHCIGIIGVSKGQICTAAGEAYSDKKRSKCWEMWVHKDLKENFVKIGNVLWLIILTFLVIIYWITFEKYIYKIDRSREGKHYKVKSGSLTSHLK